MIDVLLTSAQAAILANGVSIFKNEVNSENLFIDLKENPIGSDEQTLQGYLELALKCGQVDVVKYLINELKVALPQEKLLYSLFVKSPYETKKNSQTVIEIYKYLIEEGIDVTNPALTETIMLREVKNGNFMAVNALLELKLISSINCTDIDGHTALFYSMLMKERVTTEQLLQSGASLNGKDKTVLESIALIHNIFLEMKAKNEDKLVKLRNQLNSTNLNELPAKELESCIFKAIELNDTKTLKLLLPACDPERLSSIRYSMFGRLNSIESATYIINYFATHGSPLQKGSLAEYAHRLGLNEYESGFSQSHKYLLQVLQKYQNQPNISVDFKTIFESQQQTCLLNETSNPQVVREIINQSYLKGKPLIFAVGWAGHGVGLSVLWDEKLNKTYIVFSNRGEGGIDACLTDKSLLEKNVKYGSVVYEVDGKLDKEFFSHFQIGENKQGMFKYSQERFKQDIAICLKGAKILQPFLLATPQKYGTCSYVNSKQLVRGLLNVFNIVRGEPYTKELTDATYKLYKDFTAFDKNSGCMDLIQYYQTERDVDSKQLLKESRDFIVKVILSHSVSSKPDDIERMKMLFAILPMDVQKKLTYILPAYITIGSSIAQTSTLRHFSMFKPTQEGTPLSNSFSFNPIKIGTKSVDDLLESVIQINSLLKFFESKERSGTDIMEIILEKDRSVRICTMQDRSTKYAIKDLFPENLITNVQGQFEIIINDLDKLTNILKPSAPGSSKDLNIDM